MHDPISHAEFLAGTGRPLGIFFVLLAVMNAVAAVRTIITHRGVVFLFTRFSAGTSARFQRPSVAGVGAVVRGIAGLCFRGDPASIAWVAMPATAKELWTAG
jgi:hypothetical protein